MNKKFPGTANGERKEEKCDYLGRLELISSFPEFLLLFSRFCKFSFCASDDDGFVLEMNIQHVSATWYLVLYGLRKVSKHRTITFMTRFVSFCGILPLPFGGQV